MCGTALVDGSFWYVRANVRSMTISRVLGGTFLMVDCTWTAGAVAGLAALWANIHGSASHPDATQRNTAEYRLTEHTCSVSCSV